MPSQLTRRVLRVFLASPSDVAEERIAAERVTNRFNRSVGRRLDWQIDLHKWEDRGPAFGRPQSIINPDVDACDLFVGLLWEHWGHPTGLYSSGFEEEFERAKARHEKTGEPQIWLVFKQPRPDKVTDPGPQLSSVLRFRDKQVAANEVLFSSVENSNEWEREFSDWLIMHVLDFLQAEQSIQQPQPVASTPTIQTSAATEVLAKHGVGSGDASQVPEQIVGVARLLDMVIEAGQLEFPLSQEKHLSEFDVARLHLLSATWMSKRYTGDVLGTHEINMLYKYREKLQTTTTERFLLLRTLLSDSSAVVPGWFWFRDLKSEATIFLLLEIANSDPSEGVRIRVLLTMESGEIKPPDERWQMLPLFDQSELVRLNAYHYLGSVAAESALPILEEIEANENGAIASGAASEARLKIWARLNPNRAVLEIGSSPLYVSDELLQILGRSTARIDTATLQKGLSCTHSEVRKLCVNELAERGELSIDDAQRLSKDDSASIRAVGFKELIKKGREVDLEKIRESFEKREVGNSSFFGEMLGFSSLSREEDRREIRELVESVIISFFRTLPVEQLMKQVDWLFPNGAIAYKCLASDHYESISSHIRSDVKDGFKRVRDATLERIKSEYGSPGLELLRERVEGLDGYIREDFLESALSGVALHAEAGDLDMARSYLSHQNPRVKRAALDIICRFGNGEDIHALIGISGEASTEFRDMAAAAALRLSSQPFDVALEFVRSNTSKLVEIGFRWLLSDDSPSAKGFFEKLLGDENEANRERAVLYLSHRLNGVEMEQLLEGYIARESYHYNVVTWLDRLLYAPPPLREMYIKVLERKI
jgi:HEAT repeat protein